MKHLIATNNATITLDDDHADGFLSRHEVETSSQMAWREYPAHCHKCSRLKFNTADVYECMICSGGTYHTI